MLLEVDAGAVPADLSPGVEPLPVHLVIPSARQDRPDVHLPLREGPGLVRADHARGTEGFHGVELPNQRVALHHPLEAQREADRDDGGQPFRNRGDGEAHGGQEEDLERRGRGEIAQHEHERAYRENHDPELLPEAIQLPLEGGLRFPRLLDEAGDLAELRPHPRGDHDPPPAARLHEGPRIDHVPAVREERVAGQGVDGLGHGQGLSRERGLVRPEGDDLEEAAVRRDLVPRRQDDDVPVDELPRGDRLGLSAPHDVGPGGGEAP